MKFQSINPATEEIFGEFEGLTFEQALTAIQACKVSQKTFSLLPREQRSNVPLKKLAQLVRDGAPNFAKIITQEMGKPIAQSRAEVEKCALLCDYYATAAPDMLKPESIQAEMKKSFIRFDPLGIVLGIMPWNFPFWQVFRAAVPALAAGNCFVMKHASNVPQCSLALGKLFRDAGYPECLFQSLLIDSETALKLIPHVDAVTLTGSTSAGAKVAETAGKNLKKCVLELGGSDPFIVLADADIALSCQVALQARTINTGQSCIAAKRFIIEKSVYPDFEKKLIEHFKTLKMGDPLDETVNIGPLAKKEIRDDLKRQVDDAVKKGAKILLGGKIPDTKGWFFEPTLLTNVFRDMAVYKEEVFGPVMSLFVVENAEEAIAMANDSEFGLGTSLWTQNLALAESLAAKIEAGFVSINGMVKSDPRLPFGGVKKSGFGRELGSYGIKEFVNIKTVVVN